MSEKWSIVMAYQQENSELKSELMQACELLEQIMPLAMLYRDGWPLDSAQRARVVAWIENSSAFLGQKQQLR